MPKKSSPTNTASGQPSLEERIKGLESLKSMVWTVVLSVAAVLGVFGCNLYVEMQEKVPPYIEKAAKELVRQEIERRVPIVIEQESRQAMEKLRPGIEIIVKKGVDSAIPASVQIKWMVESLGGNITEGPRRQIERIDLTGTNVTDDDLERLESQSGIKTVKSLLLKNTSITIDGIKHLGTWESLEEVDISGTSLSPKDTMQILPRIATIKTN